MAPTEDCGRGPRNQMNVMWKINLPVSWFQRRCRSPGLVTTQTTLSLVEITWTKRMPAYVVTVHPEWRHSWSMPAGWPHDATPHTCSLHIVQNDNPAVSKTRFAGRTSQLWHRVKPEFLVIWSSISSVDGLLPFCLFVSCLTTPNHRNNTHYSRSSDDTDASSRELAKQPDQTQCKTVACVISFCFLVLMHVLKFLSTSNLH